METYVCFLRGINVGGNKIIPMTDLRRLFEKLGFGGVKTYIQSGNVVFRSTERKTSSLEKKIIEGIKNKFGFEVNVIVRSLRELQGVIASNPFAPGNSSLGVRTYFTLMLQVPTREKLAELEELRRLSKKGTSTDDDLKVIGSTIYVSCHKGWSKSPFNSSVTEKLLKVETTSRNFETMKKLEEIAKF